MPSKFLICPKNVIDQATLSATPTLVPSLPPANLQLPARGRVARSTSAAQQVIDGTWGGQGFYMNFLHLSRHNLESGATWRVQVFSDAAWTTQIYDSGTITPYDYTSLGDLDFGPDPLGAGAFDSFLGQKFSTVFFSTVLAVSFRITITNTGNSAGYVEASRLFGGLYTELLHNPDSLSLSWEEKTTQSRSEGGSLRSDGTVAYRTMEVGVAFLDMSQRAQVADTFRYAGLRKDMFVSAFPSQGGEKERDYTMLAKFVRMPKMAETSAKFNTFDVQLQLEEV